MRFFPILLLPFLQSSNLATHLCHFLPENNLRIPVTVKFQGIDENQYNAVIDKVERAYTPIAQRMGKTMTINRLWTNPRVNAGTIRDGDTWIINMYGGFARHKEVTEDGFALVICHEIGHHTGGAPKKTSPLWSSTEGQSDYFATLKCLRKVFENDDNLAVVKNSEVPEFVAKKCETSFKSPHESALCIRSILAGIAISKVSADVRGELIPSLLTPDPNIVSQTYEPHPPPQCRLDTYYAGAICEVSATALLSRSNEALGTCHKANGHEEGLRPNCWFKPR